MKQPPESTTKQLKKMTFASIYPHYVTKVEKKGRTEEELLTVIEWLTGYNEKKLRNLIKEEVTVETFIENCKINPNANLIRGSICGYKVETIEDPFMRKVRYLDKLVDELAKGKKMEKILREEC